MIANEPAVRRREAGEAAEYTAVHEEAKVIGIERNIFIVSRPIIARVSFVGEVISSVYFSAT